VKPLLSVAVPCFNEAEVLWATHGRLVGVLSHIPDTDFEIIYIDDGSTDATPEVLGEIRSLDPRVRTLRLSRNFGHQTAVSAGLEHASGDAVVLIDADLQDPPEIIPEMLAQWLEGYQVVYGVRTDREGERWFKLATAKVFYRVLDWLSDTEIPVDTGDFRLMDRSIVDVLRAMPERDRFVRGMVAWAGFRQIAVPYHRAPRFAGTSKYPFLKMVRFALDGLTSFSRAPLRLATWMGFAVSAIAIAAMVYALVLGLFTSNWVSGWPAVFMAVLFVGGAQLLSLGIIGEYIGRIYGEAKRRPLYLIEEARGFEHAFQRAATRGIGRSVPVADVVPRRRRDDGPRRHFRESDTQVPVFHESSTTRADESIA
jgi:glycosyltransferase involved in cell wall biosynthesis